MKRLEDMTEPELGELMNCAARHVEMAAAVQGVEKPRFVLVLFNDPAVAQYVANCDRRDVVKAMRETADRLERKQALERVPFPPKG